MKSNWKLVSLGEVCDIKNGYAFKSKDFCSSGIPVVKIKNVKPNQIIESDFSYVPETVANEKSKWLISKGEILLTMTGNRADGSPESWVGKAALFALEGKYLLNQRVASIKSNSDALDTEYLGYYLSSWESQLYFIKHSNSSGGQANISPTTVKEYSIFLPPIDEQKRIVSILRALDNKIKINNRINANLQQQAQAIFKSWFVDFEPFQDGEFVESELGPIPKGWRVGELSEVATITMGQSPSGKSYNEEGNGSVFFQGRAEFGDRFPIRRLYTTEPKRMAEANSVLMSVRAPVGDINVAYEKCCIGRGLASIQSKFEYSSYMLYQMLSLKRQLDVFNGEGTVFGSINRDTLNAMKVLIPNEDSIEKFECTVAPMDKLVRANYDEICRLETARDTLLPKLMNGEIEVQ